MVSYKKHPWESYSLPSLAHVIRSLCTATDRDDGAVEAADKKGEGAVQAVANLIEKLVEKNILTLNEVNDMLGEDIVEVIDGKE